ncbi:transposase [Allofournierella massiliensis]|uniref:transposase n=1 Tax=Allofournierella massiliensis TaxID=1650663 RepID=UPI00399F667A
MSYKQKLSVEEKVQIVQEYLKGRIGMNEAARRSGVRRQSFNGWVRNYEADGVDAFLPHKNRIYSPELKKGSCGRVFIRYWQPIRDLQKNIIFGVPYSSGTGFRCIMLMETSTPKNTQEVEAT